MLNKSGPSSTTAPDNSITPRTELQMHQTKDRTGMHFLRLIANLPIKYLHSHSSNQHNSLTAYI